MWWLNPSHASDDTRCISKCADKTTPMSARKHKIHFTMCWPNPLMTVGTQNVSQRLLKNPSNSSEDIKCNSRSVDQICWPHIPLTKNLSQHVFIKPIPCIAKIQNAYKLVLTNLCKRAHKMHINLCWPNPNHASQTIKCISGCVDKTPPMAKRRRMHLNMCWP